ncbi:hypothetical protein WR25_01289 [Diploscapter pachys]|uniref:NADP-dependent oxidoreductase domain-containing protein n=1 Tax=Diploscapter pachys TaxID=2018661 RepID=A0A2A2J3Z6_9BILA|nr:hypothetical protein WR25_01289 [Diploscapter pachys]
MQIKEEPAADAPSTSRPAKQTTPNITGKEVLKSFLEGDHAALLTYAKICNAIGILDKMQESARVQLLEQFFDCTDLAADDRCDQLVSCFAQLSWHLVPPSILSKFRNMLIELAIRHVHHTEKIFRCALQHFCPVVLKQDENSGNQRELTEADQRNYYKMAHHIITAVLKCQPTSTKNLLRCAQSALPHRMSASEKLRAYIRNAIQLAEKVPQLKRDVWMMVIEEIVTIDNFSTHSVEETSDTTSMGVPSIFAMDEEIEESNENEKEKQHSKSVDLLDSIISDIIFYIAKVHGVEDETKQFDSSWLSFVISSPSEVFPLFLSLLESHCLMSVHLHYVPFIWLYLGSLNKDYLSNLCDSLWSVVMRPSRVQSDMKKSHGAAAYLASFLARAKYANAKYAFHWIKKISGWLVQYVDECGPVNMGIGIRHGTFYALSQALFIIFSFRYKEFVKNEDQMEELKRLSLGRIIHSPLDPFKHINRHVALCFSAISRSLQLVYCCHLVPSEQQTEIQRSFEDMFPLDDSCSLSVSGAVIHRLLRKFAPLAEDVHAVRSAIEKAQNSQIEDATFDYLDEDEDVQMDVVDVLSFPCTRMQSHTFTRRNRGAASICLNGSVSHNRIYQDQQPSTSRHIPRSTSLAPVIDRRNGGIRDPALPPTYHPRFHDEISVRRMPHTRIPGTDLVISKIAFGSAPISGMFGNVTDSITEIIETALRLGINYIDTAYWYGQSRSELILGKVLAKIPRKAYYISTKVGRFELDYARTFDFRADKILESLTNSLMRLKLTYIDICYIQIHDTDFAPNESIILYETLQALEMAKHCGKIRYIGLTGYPLPKLASVIAASPVRIDVVMTYCHGSLNDNSLGQHTAFFRSKNVGVINSGALSWGLLTEKGPPPWHPANENIKDTCLAAVQYCASKKMDISRFALEYAINFPHTICCVVGMDCVQQVRDNVELACNCALTELENRVRDRVMRRYLDLLENQGWEGVNVEQYWKRLKKLGLTALATHRMPLEFRGLRYLSEKEIDENLAAEKYSESPELADISKSDLTPSVYEGGLKVWECALDLCNYVEQEKDALSGKTVLELGCGAGLPALMALKLGAPKAVFQDYNRFVLECFTKKNVELNGISQERVEFVGGPWSETKNLVEEKSFDFILTTETIYSEDHYGTLLDLFNYALADSGIILLAAKTYYFGVGGSVAAFLDATTKHAKFDHKIIKNIDEGVPRQIVELRRK